MSLPTPPEIGSPLDLLASRFNDPNPSSKMVVAVREGVVDTVMGVKDDFIHLYDNQTTFIIVEGAVNVFPGCTYDGSTFSLPADIVAESTEIQNF
jgi:hypothetical protein